ncbi:MAG: bifunctional phosphoglucose/phosphomannose isomerase [Candidatus Thermoplasmatota archaeon]|nr:bifunctional phosphoglucose/phosphomannose isomerase [Candidatus Thermoplasmatota archaeon]MBU1941524.1 bifunctional phosphoglucose/phosphomannose isomerase [Candidatus Thermoplasmatota archaeon]
MLDDPEILRKIDAAGMLQTIDKFPLYIKDIREHLTSIHIFKLIKVDNVIITGMGGSGIAGEIVASLLRDKLDIPFVLNRDYDLPKWVKKDTLAIFISYSGNTEETISAFKIAHQKKCSIICITSGGKLEELAEKRNITTIKIPGGLQPRAAIAYLLFSLIGVLQKTGILTHQIEPDIIEAITTAQEIISENNSQVEEAKNPAKQFARVLFGAIPQIYGWGVYTPIATRWRYQFNENSKLIARDDTLPECTHNDIVGWSSNPKASQHFSVILFRDRSFETIYLTTRIEFMKTLFKETARTVHEIYPKGKSSLAKMISLLLFGDYISCYLAILRQIDPTPIDVITELKQQLQKI